MDQLISVSLSHTHHWYDVGILKVSAGRMDDFAYWLEREPVCVPNRLRCVKPVLTVSRHSDFYLYRRLLAVLPGGNSLEGTPRAMVRRSRGPAFGSRPVRVRRFLLEYL